MVNEGNTAQSVSRTVWVLGQLRGYESKQALADAMGWDRSRLSRTLSGARQWTLEDLEEAARVLGLCGPGELFKPLADLVGAISPAAAVGGPVTELDTRRYLGGSSPSLDQLAQVLPFRPSYRTVTASVDMTPQPVTHLGASWRGRRADTA